MPAVDVGEHCEYGDVGTLAIDADTSDFSPHQVIAPGGARDAMRTRRHCSVLPSLEAVLPSQEAALPSQEAVLPSQEAVVIFQ